ncbi:hypothetical protein FISHEDRAFT_70198 [Fistulina hepatica ATCC 64428]|uniref:Uncharacterized protein n=1 Tax=Fistulina hepatica ATCC 64428 TaxID=1128425 RepID=A0A0D7AK47_9AGAR|nr:hypothetical protein FISHEDRAFT_70198 [Fistulina hepatica ATCC 64428]
MTIVLDFPVRAPAVAAETAELDACATLSVSVRVCAKVTRARETTVDTTPSLDTTCVSGTFVVRYMTEKGRELSPLDDKDVGLISAPPEIVGDEGKFDEAADKPELASDVKVEVIGVPVVVLELTVVTVVYGVVEFKVCCVKSPKEALRADVTDKPTLRSVLRTTYLR